MTDEEPAYRFEPFNRPVRERSGGIGLALIRELVARMNGRLEVVNEPQGGTTVRLWLHVAQTETAVVRRRQGVRQAASQGRLAAPSPGKEKRPH